MKYVFPEYKENVVLGDGKLQLNPMSYQVIYEGKEIDLTPREFEVLYLLAQRPNWVIPKKNIYCSVWGVIIMMIRFLINSGTLSMQDTKKDGHKEVFQGGILFTADLKGEKRDRKNMNSPKSNVIYSKFLK